MIGNNGMIRALNLDENEIPVQIGGQGYIIKQQAKVPLMRILNGIFKQEEEEETPAEPQEDAAEPVTREENIAQTFMKEWDKALPLIAMMLGADPNKEDEFNALIQHLEEHLAPMNGVKIFKAWWQLNEVDDFFGRMGRTILHPRMEAVILHEMRRRQEQLVEQIVAEELPDEAAPAE